MPSVLSDHDQMVFEQKRLELADTAGESDYRFHSRRKDSEPELLDEAAALWKKGEPFYLTGVVVAPYDGCFHEPQIWLVEPDCDDKMETVKPLYASGHGIGVDIVWNFADLVTWLSDQDLRAVLMQDDRVSPRCSRHHMLSPSGRFDSFEVHEGTELLNDLGPHEHYWAHAASKASGEWGFDAKWKCEKCDQVIVGGEYECMPVFTGYRGNGGIGVFMEGAICQECADQGMCDICREHCDYQEAYDPDVAEHGWNLCEDHTETSFQDYITGTEDISLPITVWLKRGADDVVRIVDIVDEKETPLPVTLVDVDGLIDHLENHIDEIEWYINNCGLQLPGHGIERAIERSTRNK